MWPPPFPRISPIRTPSPCALPPLPPQAMGLKEWVGVWKGLGRIFPPFSGPRCLSPCCQRGNKLCVSCRNETCSAEQMVLICSKLHSPALQSAWRAAAAAAPELTASRSELEGPCITIRGTKRPEPQDSHSSVLQGGSWLLVVRREAAPRGGEKVLSQRSQCFHPGYTTSSWSFRIGVHCMTSCCPNTSGASPSGSLSS